MYVICFYGNELHLKLILLLIFILSARIKYSDYITFIVRCCVYLEEDYLVMKEIEELWYSQKQQIYLAFLNISPILEIAYV